MNKSSFFILLLALFLPAFSAFADADAEKIAQLRADIAKLEQDLRSMQNDVPSDKTEQNYLRCYIHCIKMAPVTCRVQMSYLSKKSIPGGMYYINCLDIGKKCNYPGYGIRTSPKHKHTGCVHFEKNNYWFVTYVCKQHRYKWNFNLVRKYAALHKRYYRFDVYLTRFEIAQKQLQEKRKELNILDPPQLDIEDDVESEDTPDFITLHLGVENYVIIKLGKNKLTVTNGAKNVGSNQKLARLAPSVYFKKPSCRITDGDGAKKIWNISRPFEIGFDADKIAEIEVLKPDKKKVKIYKLDKENKKSAQDDNDDKVLYTPSQIGIYNKNGEIREYKLKITFE